MSWMKWDDRFLDHPKYVRLEDEAPSRGLHLMMGLASYCKQHLTDGRVPRDMVRKINGPHQRWRMNALDALVKVGLVELDGDDLVVHDYLDWNPSREEIGVRARKKKKPPERPPTTGRERPDNAVTTGRERPDNAVIASRQHIKKGDAVQLPIERLAPARAGSETETETETDQDPPSIPPPAPELPTTTGSTSSPKLGKRTKPPRARTQCPLDLTPDTTTAGKAWTLGFSDAGLVAELEGFVDWWRGKGLLQADWQATLRNRLRAVAKRDGLIARKPRDAQWREHQAAMRKANEPVRDPVQLPKDFGGRMEALFG